MAWDPTKPAASNLVLSDITAIRENFEALADSRIVDHNLDVADPPNGWYVRWENGLQVCMRAVILANFTGGVSASASVVFPATFNMVFAVLCNCTSHNSVLVTAISPSDSGFTMWFLDTGGGGTFVAGGQFFAIGTWS